MLRFVVPNAVFLTVLYLLGSATSVVTAQEAAARDPGKPRLVVQSASGQIFCVAFAPDGKSVLSGGMDKTARLLESETGLELQRFTGHSLRVDAVAFSRDGERVLTGSDDHTARLWERVTGRELRRLKHRSGVTSVAFSPNGKSALTGTLSSVKLWQLDDPGAPPMALSEATQPVAFSLDGRLALTGGKDNAARLWDSAGKPLQTFKGHQGSVGAVAFSPDGKLIVTASYASARLWEVRKDEPLCEFHRRARSDGSGWVESVAFAPDGKSILTGSNDNTARLWNLEGELLQTLQGHSDDVSSVAFSPVGRRVLTGSHDRTLRLWDPDTGEESRRFEGHAAMVSSVAWSPDGKRVLVGSQDGSARLWGLDVGRELRRLGGHSDDDDHNWVQSVAFSPDSGLVLTGSDDNTARLWDPDTGRERQVFEGHSDDVSSVAFAPDGERILTGSWDATARLWDLEGKQLQTFRISDGNPWAVAIAPKGPARVLTGSDNATAQLWDADTGSRLRSFSHDKWVESVAFSPNGKRILTGSWDHTARLWNADSGAEVQRFDGHDNLVSSVAFSPDGTRVLTGSYDNTARLWDAATGRELQRFVGHALNVRSVAFSPDGRRVLTGSLDATARLWNVETGDELVVTRDALATLKSMADGSWVVTTPDGRFDTNNLEEIKGVHWIMPDEPDRPLPLEIFMRDYFEPKLLARVMAGDKLPDVPDLTRLNRVQPEVTITRVVAHAGDPERVDVHVEVKSVTRAVHSVPVESGARDLHVFRDGQLVGLLEGDLLASGGSKTFEGVRLALTGAKEVQFSAYAFNTDRVKSDTARKAHSVPGGLARRRGRAYIVSIGVNRYDTEAWNLRFAVNDAVAIQQTLPASLTRLGAYASVIKVPLYSDEERHLATKADFKAVVDLLAGRGEKVDAEQRARIANADEIEPARPEDLVVFSFSGHGHAGDGKLGAHGAFYFLLSDIGKSADVNEELLARTVSSEELTQWLRAVDAGKLAFIIDACHSASSVEGEGFKPGPMGSRGLGQLAYDKGMLILAASQADNVAFEDNELQHGFLTYSLAQEGLANFMADAKPKDGSISLAEWLDYGVGRVPGLYVEVKSGKHEVIELGARGARRRKNGAPRPPAQQPSLFNFRRGVPLEIGRKR